LIPMLVDQLYYTLILLTPPKCRRSSSRTSIPFFPISLFPLVTYTLRPSRDRSWAADADYPLRVAP
jgi:hypothetical protein